MCIRDRAYAFDVACEIDPQRKGVTLTISNGGEVGVALNVYAAGGQAGPWSFTVEPSKSIRHEVLAGVEAYDLSIHGPNGFFRHFRGGIEAMREPEVRFESGSASIALEGQMTLSRYGYVPADHEVTVTAGMPRVGLKAEAWTVPLSASGNWYDFEVTSSTDPTFLRRYAGHIETGAPSISDPLIGQRP